jgi:hypothetical protein
MMPEFSNVVEFAQWYLKQGMPIQPPEGAEVFHTDDSASFCLFRRHRFQIEQYLIHPMPVIPEHEHPYVEAIEINISEIEVLKRVENLNVLVLKAGQAHGNTIRAQAMDKGFMLLSAQHWLGDGPMHTIGAMWKGPTAGPLHNKLIRRFHPNCVSMEGYADITSTNKVASVL